MVLATLATAQVSLQTLGTSLSIEDQTKECLDCYDDWIKPEPKPISALPNTTQDCRFLKEEDERLNCFNRFVNAQSNIPPTKNSRAQQKVMKPALGTTAPAPAKQ